MTVSEAIEVAKGHLTTVLPELAASFQIEELETPPYRSNWSFTFSALPASGEASSALAQLLRQRRVTKSVEIDAESGALISIKNAVA
ncbi:hypothetical protein [Granulicella sibirica]|uniref:hypothetical protein n=1 Tax=Granulicella sibirica TaxID=2479048 RepID=UPI00100917F1|nr:hypothetical protein [Granulicella sibirica]